MAEATKIYPIKGRSGGRPGARWHRLPSFDAYAEYVDTRKSGLTVCGLKITGGYTGGAYDEAELIYLHDAEAAASAGADLWQLVNNVRPLCSDCYPTPTVYCEECASELTGEAHALEMSIDGRYAYEGQIPEIDSQGVFTFGRDCARRLMAERPYKGGASLQTRAEWIGTVLHELDHSTPAGTVDTPWRMCDRYSHHFAAAWAIARKIEQEENNV